MIKNLPNCPYLIAVPATSLVVALGSTGLALGPAGIIAGAALGLVWSIALGIAVERLIRHSHWKRLLANGSVLLTIVASGLMLGGGLMYGLLMRAAAIGPADVLSAMMQPTIPFFIILNTPLELVAVPCAVFANWHNATRRRLIVIGAAAFYTLRVWSYLVYVPMRMEIASRPLLPQDLEWFQRSMAIDYRSILVAIVFVLFIFAAFVPDLPANATPPSRRNHRAHLDRSVNMRAGILVAVILVTLWPQATAAQGERPRENTVAIGGDVGFLASDNGRSTDQQPLQSATGNVDAFVEYHYAPRTSLRLMSGWAAPQFDKVPGRTLRRQHLNLNFLYHLEFGRFRVFGTVGGGAYFLSGREAGSLVGRAVTKPGGSVGWGGEYYFRTFRREVGNNRASSTWRRAFRN